MTAPTVPSTLPLDLDFDSGRAGATARAADSPAALDPCPSTAHEQAGFDLGWDYARHRETPPVAYVHEASALRSGLVAGRAAFGARRPRVPVDRHVRQWLQLRLHAWLRGRSVERVQVTPHYLRQIDATHCPVTRVALAGAGAAAEGGDGMPPSIDRVRDDAGYAAGNLAVMSRRANHAKGRRGRDEALRIAGRLEAEPAGAMVDGLGAAEWARIATLCSFVEPMPHAEAAALPMRVLPPNRLRLFNPVQALQALLSRQFLKPGWSARLARFEALLPGPAPRRDFRAFAMTLMPRVIEATARSAAEPAALRWAVEDAWRGPLVQQRWTRFARQLDAERCEALVARAVAEGLATTAVMPLTDAGATDGWALETRGWLPHATASGGRAVSSLEAVGR